MGKSKKTRDEMIDIAYKLQNSIMEVTHKRPIRITTNREHSVIRVVWMQGYEKKEWYSGTGVKIIIEAFIQKYGVYIHEITKDRDKKTSVWLTKRANAPK